MKKRIIKDSDQEDILKDLHLIQRFSKRLLRRILQIFGSWRWFS